MSNAINRAAELIDRHILPLAEGDPRIGDGRIIARALDAAGLLTTPAHDAAALVAELVRRGVLTEDDGGECDLDTRIHSVNCSCFGRSQRQRRYVTAWEPDTRTPLQRSDELPLHRTEAGYPHCSTCDGGGCLDCTDPA